MKKLKKWEKLVVSVGTLVASVCAAFSGISGTATGLFSVTPAYATESEITDTHGFIKVDGEKLYDEHGQEYVIKSMGMGNDVWSNPDNPVVTYATEESYKELSELGFNAVRFYVNVNLLEDKNNPYNYKETGFAWVSKNVEWAKKYNMKVLINMHVPAGGFLQPGSVGFWKEENVARYKALWMEIVRRYKDESAILGWGLLNEPYIPSQKATEPADLPGDSAEVKKQKKAQRDAQQQIYYNEAKDMYYNLMNEVTDKIRAAGDNHIVFVERVYGCVMGGVTAYPWAYTDSYELLSDNNVVYEYHYYYSLEYTHQELSWVHYSEDLGYPNDKIAYVVGARTFPKVHKNTVKNYDPTASGWQKIESSMIKNDGSFNYGYWLFETSKIGSSGDVYIDEITISEYDEDGKYVRDVYMYDFSVGKDLNVWNRDETGKVHDGSLDGHNLAGCMKIHGGDKGVRCYLNNDAYMNVVMKKGYSYKVSAYVKFENCSENATFDPEIQLCKGVNVMTSGKDYLEYMLNIFLDFGRNNHVPMYMGEFSTTSYMMVDPDGDKWVKDEYHNGGQWVEDMLDLFNKYKAHYSYHDYHNENFGMYMDKQDKFCTKAKLNWVLYDVFERKIEKNPVENKPTIQLEAGDGKINVNWNKISGATKYRVFVYSSGKYEKIGDTTSTSYIINNLVNGKEVGVYVIAYINGSWIGSKDSYIKYATPVAPTCTVPVLMEQDKSVAVSWNQVSGATKYRVFTYSKGTYNKIADTANTQYTIKNLTNGKEVGVYVIAYIGGSWKGATKEYVRYATPVADGCTYPKLTAGNKQIAVSWKEVSGATKYRVFTYSNGSYTKVAETADTKYTIKNLGSGKEVGVYVIAYVNGSWKGATKEYIRYATPK